MVRIAFLGPEGTFTEAALVPRVDVRLGRLSTPPPPRVRFVTLLLSPEWAPVESTAALRVPGDTVPVA